MHRGLLDESVVLAMEECIPRRNQTTQHGVRGLFARAPGLQDLFDEHVLRPLASTAYQPVRTLLFNKTKDRNWNVAWHQDTTIDVTGAGFPDGFCNIRERAGHISVEPPRSLLDRIRTYRIHLDDSDRFNGCLRVVPGSHRQGRIASSDILRSVQRGPVFDLEVHRGDVMVMHPLLFHSSRKVLSPLQRRVIHVECCDARLPPGLEWAEPTVMAPCDSAAL